MLHYGKYAGKKSKNKKLAFFTPLITALGGRGSLSIVPRHPELLQRNSVSKSKCLVFLIVS